jgi:hypothetical protein
MRVSFHATTKSPLKLIASAGREFMSAYLSQLHPRPHAMRVMMMAVVTMRLHLIEHTNRMNSRQQN